MIVRVYNTEISLEKVALKLLLIHYLSNFAQVIPYSTYRFLLKYEYSNTSFITTIDFKLRAIVYKLAGNLLVCS